MITNLRSTFPLDEAAIARTAFGRIVVDPITWVSLLPAVAAFTVFDVPWFVALLLAILIVGGLVGFWRGRWNGLLDKIRHQSIASHNLAQNEALQLRANQLRETGHAADARRLEEFLAMKKLIEHRLHDEGALTPQKIQLEQLVDSLCFEVRDQLSALARQQQNSDPAVHEATVAQVDAAFKTLLATVADLDAILGPIEVANGTAGASLEELTRRLREEAEIARRVQARLQFQPSIDGPPSLPVAERE